MTAIIAGRFAKTSSAAVCAVLLACVAARAETQEAVERARASFVERMVDDHGFDRAELTDLLAGATIEQSILDAISRPAERVVPWYEYRKIFLNDARIAAGVQFWRDHEVLVRGMAERYGVAPEMLLAIIGVETFFGQRMGRYRVLDALSTLAFAYPPRAKFFSSELESFLLLAREDNVDVTTARGSYAGAMGAGQFIPSSYRAYAVDANADGRVDLWTDWEDVLASVANYFNQHGWREGAPVVERATRAANAGEAETNKGLDLRETVGSLHAAGFEFVTDLPAQEPAGAFAFEAEDGGTEYWIGYHNFRVITRYNSSPKYALAAYQLGEAIRAGFEAARSAAE